MQSLLDTQQAHTRNQPHATPEGALDTTREQALTETGVPQPAVTRAAHNAAGPPRGALYSDTDREVWLTAGHTTGHTHATARRNATDGGTRLTASPTDSSDWRPAGAVPLAHTSVPPSTLTGFLLAVHVARDHASAPLMPSTSPCVRMSYPTMSYWYSAAHAVA